MRIEGDLARAFFNISRDRESVPDLKDVFVDYGGAVDNARPEQLALHNTISCHPQNQSFGVILGTCRNADLNISISVLRTSVRNPAGNHRIFVFVKKQADEHETQRRLNVHRGFLCAKQVRGSSKYGCYEGVDGNVNQENRIYYPFRHTTSSLLPNPDPPFPFLQPPPRTLGTQRTTRPRSTACTTQTRRSPTTGRSTPR